MGRLGFGEIMIIALVALLLFGATRIADIGKGLGEGIKNFKRGLKDGDDFDDPGAPKQLPKAEEGEKKALAPAAGPA
ncbi:MAG: twin-arginine translocase TatA/TatE family subunit [Polyangiaceae bacterium]|jgi:sec-independent protein translocase protein TatA|nr:twin-arginine translocase TatA/TatE family subunit [Polyangiaceae bacterium]